ncbi:hypothetical protein QE364_000250 [Nocardioides zeae]|uniref:Uncharacterized protein n=2 Tax=Nocardioides zeae TaxID=1457234 RepID=A0ACC6ICV7_9ACTN|nr:hypothetical protein [Nocardioides zeae]MDR6175633.1 hypothetical protein [Nocardioides zeae]MDR6208562.1 hypothetical protein [Nocardioides zeae]
MPDDHGEGQTALPAPSDGGTMTGTQDAPDVAPGPAPGLPPGGTGPVSRRPSPYAAELAHLLGPGAPAAPGAPDRGPVLDPQPGPVPLRPLGLGDVLDAALTIVRRAPGPTVGPGLVVAALALLVPTALVVLLDGLGGRLPRGDGASASVAALLESGVVVVANGALSFIGTVLLTGVVAHVVHAAATGHLLSLEEAWRRTRGRRWAMLGASVGLTLVLGVLLAAAVAAAVAVGAVVDVGLFLLLCLLGVPLLLVAASWFTVRLTVYVVPAIALERTGVVAGVRRGFRLSRGGFLRSWGVLVLASIVAGVATTLLAVPLFLVGELAPRAGGGAGEVVATVALVAAAVVPPALAAPYLAAVIAVLYLDRRIRTEGYDVTLRAEGSR